MFVNAHWNGVRVTGKGTDPLLEVLSSRAQCCAGQLQKVNTFPRVGAELASILQRVRRTACAGLAVSYCSSGMCHLYS